MPISPLMSDSGPQPNDDGNPSRGPAGLIIGGTLMGLATLLLALRLYTRHWISHALGLDDILIIAAYIPAVAFGIVGVIAQVFFGWGTLIKDRSPRSFARSLQANLASQILFDVSTSLTKLSMLAMLYRLTKASGDKRMTTVVLTLAGVISLNAFLFIIVTVFQCSPVSAYWTLELKPDHCINEPAHLIAAGTINTVTDFVLVFVPVRTVMALELPLKQRIVVMALFSVGLLASAAGVARVYFTTELTMAKSQDRSWHSWGIWLSSAIELDLGIICASIPAVKAFFAHHLPNVIDATMKSRKTWTKAVSRGHSRNVSASSDTAAILPSHDPPSPARLAPTQPDVEEAKADLNKPLPRIQEKEAWDHDGRLSGGEEEEEAPGEKPPLKGILSPRGAVRFSSESALQADTAPPGPRTTVLIMYKGDERNISAPRDP